MVLWWSAWQCVSTSVSLAASLALDDGEGRSLVSAQFGKESTGLHPMGTERSPSLSVVHCSACAVPIKDYGLPPQGPQQQPISFGGREDMGKESERRICPRKEPKSQGFCRSLG